MIGHGGILAFVWGFHINLFCPLYNYTILIALFDSFTMAIVMHLITLMAPLFVASLLHGCTLWWNDCLGACVIWSTSWVLAFCPIKYVIYTLWLLVWSIFFYLCHLSVISVIGALLLNFDTLAKITSLFGGSHLVVLYMFVVCTHGPL